MLRLSCRRRWSGQPRCQPHFPFEPALCAGAAGGHREHVLGLPGWRLGCDWCRQVEHGRRRRASMRCAAVAAGRLLMQLLGWSSVLQPARQDGLRAVASSRISCCCCGLAAPREAGLQWAWLAAADATRAHAISYHTPMHTCTLRNPCTLANGRHVKISAITHIPAPHTQSVMHAASPCNRHQTNRKSHDTTACNAAQPCNGHRGVRSTHRPSTSSDGRIT